MDLDLPTTWPAGLRSAAYQGALRVRGSTEYADYHYVPSEVLEDLHAELQGQAIRCYHCTRLLDAEVEVIRRDGLRAASDRLIEDKLAIAVEAGAITPADAAQLHSTNMLLHQRKNRADQISACSTRRTLDAHADGVRPFLATWGGEIIYFHQTDPELKATLRTLGRPAVVVIDLEWRPGSHDLWLPEVPFIAIGRMLGTVDLTGGVHYRLSSEKRLQVAAVWQPGDAEYDRRIDLLRQ